MYIYIWRFPMMCLWYCSSCCLHLIPDGFPMYGLWTPHWLPIDPLPAQHVVHNILPIPMHMCSYMHVIYIYIYVFHNLYNYNFVYIYVYIYISFINMSDSTYIAPCFPVNSLKIPDEYCTQEPMDLLLHYLSICSIVLPMNPLCMHTYRTCFCLGSIYYMFSLLG